MMRIADQLRSGDLIGPACDYAAGPWHLDERGLTVLCGGWRSWPGKKTICTIRPHHRTPEAVAETMATARLIASAPDMRGVCASFSVAERDGRIAFRVLGVEVAAFEVATHEALILRQLGANRCEAISKAGG